MFTTQSVSSFLFKVAAGLNAISVPGHIKYGFEHLNPAMKMISSSPELKIGEQSAIVGWDYMNATLLIAAVLNWRWSHTNGPRENSDKFIFWTLLAAGGFVGFRYWRLSSFKPLISLWIAPVLGLFGWVIAA